MAKQSLAVKYRPKSFDEVTEQSSIKAILTEQLKTKTFQHSYLFTGPAGCGKTTAARIFANEINEHKGTIIEIDAASNNGVDDVRQIIESSKRKSLDSEYKCFILDECHMLSTAGWNALLKLLEEPPKYSIFLMCTTDPQKIPATIMSRVQRYNFTKIPMDKIVDRLHYIISSECTDGVTVEEQAVQYIAKLANGGMRDAITMLDKCLSLSKNLSLEAVLKSLGTVDYDTFFALTTNIIIDKNVAESVKIIEEVYSSGKDLKLFIKSYQNFLVDLCKIKLFDNFTYTQIPETVEFVALTTDYEIEDCKQLMDFIIRVNNAIKWDSSVIYTIEALLINYMEDK